MSNDNKLVRQTITVNTAEMNKNIRPKIGRTLKLDASVYQRAYPDKKLMWIAENGTDLEVWLDNGAQPVPAKVEGRKTYKGINDKADGEWVSKVGGKDASGTTYRLYLLMIDPALYDELKTGPEMERQREIEDAMKIGANASDIAGHLPGGGGIQTYAPTLSDGVSKGFNQIRTGGR